MTPLTAFDLQFDGLVHFVPDLEMAMAHYQALGIPLGAPRAGAVGTGIRMAQWHTRGLQYIEAVTVQDRALAANAYPDWPAIERVMQAGGGGGRVHLLVADVETAVERLRARGATVAGPQARTITAPTGEAVTYQTARVLAGHPWDPFVINYGIPPHDMFALRQTRGFYPSPWMVSELVVETLQPGADAAWLADLLGAAVIPGDGGSSCVTIPGCTLRFVSGPAGLPRWSWTGQMHQPVRWQGCGIGRRWPSADCCLTTHQVR